MKQIGFSCCWGHICMTAQLPTPNTTRTRCCSPACQWAMTEDSFHILKCLNEISYCQKYVIKLLFSVSPAHTPQCPQMSEEMVREGPNWNKLGWTFHAPDSVMPEDCGWSSLFFLRNPGASHLHLNYSFRFSCSQRRGTCTYRHEHHAELTASVSSENKERILGLLTDFPNTQTAYTLRKQ